MMVNGGKNRHSCAMKIAEGVRKHAAEHGGREEKLLTNVSEAKTKEFIETGAEVYANV